MNLPIYIEIAMFIGSALILSTIGGWFIDRYIERQRKEFMDDCKRENEILRRRLLWRSAGIQRRQQQPYDKHRFIVKG